MATRLLTPICILSYPHVAKPKANDDGKEKYQAAFVFTDESVNTPEFAALKAAVNKEFAAAIPDADERAKLARNPNFKRGLRSDETAIEKYAGIGGRFVINASSETQPGVVYAFPDTSAPKRADGTYPPMQMKVEDYATKLYPGCKVRASISVYYFDRKGNKGIGFGLNNLQLVGDGDRLDNRTRADQDFAAIEDAPAMQVGGASVDDLLG